MDKDGRAYTNTLVDGKVYGPDGTRIQSDSGWDIVTVEEDVYKDSDYTGAEVKENAKPVLTAGSSVIVNNSGKLKKNGKVKLDGVDIPGKKLCSPGNRINRGLRRIISAYHRYRKRWSFLCTFMDNYWNLLKNIHQ
ncbi:MAG: hypothetical protein ACLVAV_09360 [Clostridium sp.]